jgi:predicted membrane metal-binding protein
MSNKKLLRRTITIHPLFIAGLAILLVSVGAILGQTIFLSFATVIGVSALQIAILWSVIGAIILTIGLWR